MEKLDGKLVLSLPENEVFSEFMLEVINEEIESINNNLKLEENDIEIITSYVNELEDKLEACIYIVNNTSQRVNFGRLDLSLIKDNEFIVSQTFESKEIGEVPPKSIKYNIIYFPKENVKVQDFLNAKVTISKDVEINSKNTINVDCENIPSSLGKKDLTVIKKYLNSLPYLEINHIDINVASISYDELGNLLLVMIVRNGYEKDIVLAALPMRIYDAEENLIYSGSFSTNELNIKTSSAKIINIVIKKEDILYKSADLLKCRFEFK
jgi:SLAP domain-containing protein